MSLPEENPKVMVMLAGPGHDTVFYQMQPPFLSDTRLVISATATQWSTFEQTLSQMRPDLLVIQAEIAPGPDGLIQLLATMQVWRGVAIVVLSATSREMRDTFEKVAVVRGVYITPVNWGEMTQAGYAAVITERARAAAAAPLQQSYLSRTPTAVVGTRVIAFMSASGGTGRSMVAENLGYELAVHMSTRSLLMSFDLPSSASAHLNLHFVPNAIEYFANPADGFNAAMQHCEALDVILGPDNSVDYQRAARYSAEHRSEPDSIYSLVMSSWTRNYAAVLLDLPQGEQIWSLQGIAAANTAVIVARCTLADMAATRHSLILLLERLAGEHRIPRESIYLVLNQASENSPISVRGFHDELTGAYGWAPPVAAVIPYDPAISQLQDRQILPVTRVEALAKAIRQLAETLYPGSLAKVNGNHAWGKLRFPWIKLV